MPVNQPTTSLPIQPKKSSNKVVALIMIFTFIFLCLCASIAIALAIAVSQSDKNKSDTSSSTTNKTSNVESLDSDFGVVENGKSKFRITDSTKPDLKNSSVISTKFSDEITNANNSLFDSSSNFKLKAFGITTANTTYNYAAPIRSNWTLETRLSDKTGVGKIDYSEPGTGGEFGILYMEKTHEDAKNYTTCKKQVQNILVNYMVYGSYRPGTYTTTTETVHGNTWERVEYTYDLQGTKYHGMDQCLYVNGELFQEYSLLKDSDFKNEKSDILRFMNETYLVMLDQ
jgi:hypothetical protein